MTDERMAKLIRLLLMLSPIAHQCQQGELFALFSIICQKLTLEHGNSDAAAEVYAMFSIIYKVFTGDSEGAYQWSNLAREVDKRNGFTKQARVHFIHCWFIALWKEPLHSMIPLADEGADAGFRLGDILYACFNLSLCVVLKCVSGRPLKEVKETAQAYYVRNNQTVLNAAFHLVMEEQMAKALEGLTNGPTSLTDEKYNEERDIASICLTDLYNQIAYYFIGKLKLAVHYGHWAEAVDWGNKSLPLLPAFMNQPGQIELEQYHTMAMLYRAHETQGVESDTLKQAANAGIEKLKGWANVCTENFGHKAMLAEAIRDALQLKDSAENDLISAAETARQKGYIQDCGLAYEHLAWSRKSRGLDTKQAVASAIEAYTEWGALAKVRFLEKVFGH
jgi:tetratricopeptide (TPR) repeat protein